METPAKTYIRQIAFDGSSYSKGSTVELLSTFNIICEDFPFQRFPRRKDLPTRDWLDEHGLDVYVPSELPLKEYDLEAKFLYVRTRIYDGGTAQQKATEEAAIRSDISNFIDFLYGRKKGGVSDTVQSARLAIYNDYVGMGRKDVVVSEVSNEFFYFNGYDSDVVAEFKVRFTVYDPVTEVTKSGSTIDWEWPTT